MSKALVLGAAALVFSAASASAQVYTTPDYGYAEPVADLAAPADGYAAPAPPPGYTAPPVYAAPVYTACFIVTDSAGQKGYEEEPSRRSAAKLLTRNEARRIAPA